MQGIAGLGYEVHYEPLVPSGGINNYQKAAELLKEFGRNGDTYIVHAAEGETMIPMEVLDKNPRLKKMLWKQLVEMGIEPERYVVGNELNSINPVTGQPEFFFKKVFKTLKRTVKNVAKVAKAVAPVVLAVAAPFALPMLATPLAAGLGSLAGGLIQGRSFKDSLKGAIIAGGLAGTANLMGGGNFFGSISNPQAGLGSFGSQSFEFTNPFSNIGGAGAGGIPKNYSNLSLADKQKILQQQVTGAPTSYGNMTLAQKQNYLKSLTDDSSSIFGNLTDSFKLPDLSLSNAYDKTTTGISNLYDKTTKGISDIYSGGKQGASNFYNQYISPSRASIQPTGTDIAARASEIAKQDVLAQQSINDAITKIGGKPATIDFNTISANAVNKAKSELAPSFLTKYGPSIGAGIGVASLADSATGGAIFGAPEEEKLQGNTLTTGFDLLKQNPEKYGFTSAFYGDNPYYQTPAFMPRMVKQGGEIVGPGTGTSDSIPAMLSDGEFVMTARAVEGAGNGDRSQGAKRMYAMMRKFEGSRA